MAQTGKVSQTLLLGDYYNVAASLAIFKWAELKCEFGWVFFNKPAKMGSNFLMSFGSWFR